MLLKYVKRIVFLQVESKLKAEMKTGLLKFTNDDLTTDEVSTGWNYLNMNVSTYTYVIHMF